GSRAGRGWRRTSSALVGATDRVSPELLAEGGDRLHGGRLLLPGGEAGEERSGDGRGGHGVVDGFLEGPAALAGVVGVVVDAREARVALEGVDEQLEEPRADDGATLPRAQHGR